MEQLILVERSARGPLVADERLARFAVRRAHQGWRAEVATLAGADAVSRAGVAEVARFAIAVNDGGASDGGDARRVGDAHTFEPFGRRDACFASPVHVQVGRYGGRLQHESLLRLSPDESAGLLAQLVLDEPARGLALRALPDGGWLALLDPVGEVRTFDPESVLDTPIDTVMPEGAGGAALRRITTDLEIWLHALPLNHARALRGEPPITTFWLWGCGARVAPASVAPSKGLHVASRDAYLLGMAHLLHATVHESRVEDIAALLRTDATSAIADANALVPQAVTAVREGRIGQLFVVRAAETLALRRSDLFRFWRRRRAE